MCDDCRIRGEQFVEREGRIVELLGCLTWDGFVPKKARRKVDRLRNHRFAQITLLAEELLKADDLQRQISKAQRDREFAELKDLRDAYDNWLADRVDRLGTELALRLD